MTTEQKRAFMEFCASNPLYTYYETQARWNLYLGLAITICVPPGLFILLLALA